MGALSTLTLPVARPRLVAVTVPELAAVIPLASTTRPLRGTEGPGVASVCRAPIPGQAPWRRCMLATAHDARCLPVPDGRGMAVR